MDHSPPRPLPPLYNTMSQSEGARLWQNGLSITRSKRVNSVSSNSVVIDTGALPDLGRNLGGIRTKPGHIRGAEGTEKDII